jgi:hypothetical protein
MVLGCRRLARQKWQGFPATLLNDDWRICLWGPGKNFKHQTEEQWTGSWLYSIISILYMLFIVK